MLGKILGWNVELRPENTSVSHFKFVLKRKQIATVMTNSYNSRLVVFSNGRYKDEEDKFSSLSDFTATMLIICFSAQRCRGQRHFNFQNAFFNKKLERSVYAELRKI